MSGRPVRVCALEELGPTGATTFELDDAEVIVVAHGGAHYGYYNRCPHRGTTLDWAPGRVLSADGAHLQCATHGALFEPHTGRCVQGPCVGDRLTPVRLQVADGALWCS